MSGALPRFMIAAAHKSSGKTVVSTGLTAALARRGQVAVFKKGPDYIDPMWLQLAAGRAAYNLDFNTMGADEIRALFAAKAAGADVSLIEANKGLYDGVAADGSDSNAALAKLLDVPVVLVVDCKGMTRGIAPLLLGYRAFDPDVRIAGVILNKTGGARHEGKLRSAVETYTDVPVLGALAHEPDMDISERHLGLTTPAEVPELRDFVDRVAARVAAGVDLERLRQVAGLASNVDWGAIPVAGDGRDDGAINRGPPACCGQGEGNGLRIGIARDEAFGFYYADDLEAFAAAGAALVPVDMIRDAGLPDGLDGLFIGGGFPETQAARLAANGTMLGSVRRALEAGLPAYAECGGLMYLTRSISWGGDNWPMVGFFDADTVMQDRPQGRGYARYVARSESLWARRPDEARAHEFHYARLENVAAPVFARDVTRGFGIDGRHDALVRANTQAGFIHLRHSAGSPWVTDFLDFAAGIKTRSGRAA